MIAQRPHLRYRLPRPLLLLVPLLLALAVAPAGAATPPDRAVQVSASVQKSPPTITLSWPADPNATQYAVSRKTLAATTWGTPTNLPGATASYADTNVQVGAAYEYQIVKSAAGYQGYGYIYAGIEAPLVEKRGTVILITESGIAAGLSAEIARLQQDLAGDGWTVIRHSIAKDQSPPAVRALIKADYDKDRANVKAVFLLGHVPVPYSGQIAPDGHGNHVGAWPADMYYGDMDGAWTDTTVNNTAADRNENDNVPGDGKFDQSSPPSAIELEVGRVDLANMPAFAPKTELDLLRQYLDKDHSFRHGLISAQQRGLVDDNFGDFGGEAFASSGWRNFAPFFGAANTQALDWFGTLKDQSYLWAYGCGGGSYSGAGGVGSTSDFKNTGTQAVFNMLFGSYFGDWDSQDNFLRAPLASAGYGLTNVWAGRPHWFFHHMALGETIGFSTRLTQNNNYFYSPANFGAYYIHVALMGDPTLRMHPVAPATALTATATLTGGVLLSWMPSPDQQVRGYYVYRAPDAAGPFTRVSPALVTGARFADTTAPAGASVYMVRAVKLEITPSGSYFNASQGIFQAAAAPKRIPTFLPVARR